MLKLKDLYLFQGIDEDLIDFVIDNSRRVEYIEGDYILHEGQESDNTAYIIQSGTAKVEKDGEVIASLEPGDLFGEISLITNENRTASVRAETHLVLLKLNRDLLHKIIREFKNGREVQKELIRRILENNQKNTIN